MQTGLERFLQDPALRAPLAGRRVALLEVIPKSNILRSR